MSRLAEYFSKVGAVDADSEEYMLFSEVARYRLEINTLRQQQILETVALTTTGCRGDEAKILIQDQKKFDELATQIAKMQATTANVERLFIQIDKVIDETEAAGYRLRTPCLTGLIAAKHRSVSLVERYKQAIQEAARSQIDSGCPPHLVESACEDIVAKYEPMIKKAEDDIEFLNSKIDQVKSILDPSRKARYETAQTNAEREQKAKAEADAKSGGPGLWKMNVLA